MADPEAVDLRPKAEKPTPVPITTADLRFIAETLLSLATWLEATRAPETSG